MTDREGRILLLSAESPHSTTPGGIVLMRLLHEYSDDQVLVVSNHPPPRDSSAPTFRYLHLPLAADRLSRTRFANLRPNLRALGVGAWFADASADRLTREYTPDIVLTLMQDAWYYDLAARYAQRHRLPLVLLVHDLPAGFEPAMSRLKRLQHNRDLSVLKIAAKVLVISENMQYHFRKSFGVDSEVLLPPRAEHPVIRSPGATLRLVNSPHLTIGFAGGLHYGYGEQLLAMQPVFAATRTKVELFCPTPSGKSRALLDYPQVFRINPRMPSPEQAWRLLSERCDALIQPYLNPPGPHEEQYRTHFPSKLGDALSLGMPLLVTGPANASGQKWCLSNPGSALSVVEPGAAAMANALLRLRDDSALRHSLATCAESSAREFDAPTIRRKLMYAIQQARRSGAKSTPVGP